jgi:hypothetical protein
MAAEIIIAVIFLYYSYSIIHPGSDYLDIIQLIIKFNILVVIINYTLYFYKFQYNPYYFK